ncbi:DNA-binding transcriptional activator EvgA [Serratia odorifera]|jgi:DNA-binding NarL/FixJ family response regulator|uniref:Transcriptional regulator, LuxR family n=3 Tax=Serratia odorifera TaxID=618 RepID=D4E8Z1_SEROD|nr:transcriptional regulator, LuxR family [Serratia odorifera DSM 4582]PNK88629.1 DNA-binding response regulator [Serratia odorifera]RII69576.1 DNA-binding response regulator [Serratia odorifera]VDZ65337.1 DNA-binding transcriptional activator EvgA [Serratia odorifera]
MEPMQIKMEAGNFIFYDPVSWVHEGLMVLLQPSIIGLYQAVAFNQITAALEMQPRQTVIMELYGVNERVIDGVRFILEAKNLWPETAWVVFTDIENYSVLHLLASIPQIALVSKRDGMALLLTGIESARAGQGYQSPCIAQTLLRHPCPAPVKGLSGSEWRIMAMMVAGLTPQRIAISTRLAYKTVSSHKRNILNKLCSTRTGFIKMLLTLRKRAI